MRKRQAVYRNQTSSQSSRFTGFTGIAFWCGEKVAKPGCCFNHKIGLPIKKGVEHPIYPYETNILDTLNSHKLLWIKKATGLGITEFMLRYIAWKALESNEWRNQQVVIITGARLELAISIIERIKRLFDMEFDTKNTILELNGCKIEAFPSHHLDSARGLPSPAFVLIDEADFFPRSQQHEARSIAERYIAKSNPYIVLVSTPNLPNGLMELIEREENSIYHKIKLPYTVGLDGIYDRKEIEFAKHSPSFEREYNLRYGIGVGNMFNIEAIDDSIEDYALELNGGKKILALDPAFSSSMFAFIGMEQINGISYVKEASEIQNASPSAMLERAKILAKDYDNTVLVDSAHPGIVRDLQDAGINAKPVVFSKELSEMTIGSIQAIKERKIRIHSSFNDLVTQLKSVQFNEKGHPDKTKLSFDMGDAFMMATNYFRHIDVGAFALEGSF